MTEISLIVTLYNQFTSPHLTPTCEIFKGIKQIPTVLLTFKAASVLYTGNYLRIEKEERIEKRRCKGVEPRRGEIGPVAFLNKYSLVK